MGIKPRGHARGWAARLIAFVFMIVALQVASAGAANHRLDAPEAGLSFSLPSTWPGPFKRATPRDPRMTPDDPLYLVLDRQPILDGARRPVTPGLTVVAFRAEPDIDARELSDALIGRRGYAVRERLRPEEMGAPGSVGSLAMFEPRPGLRMMLLDVVTVRDGFVTELVFSATEPVFRSLEWEMREILRDLRPLAPPRPKPAGSAVFAWRAGDPPPPILGLALGDRREDIVARLGPPTSETPVGAPDAGVLEMTYADRGLALIVTPAEGLAMIRLLNSANALDGFKVGDETARLVAKWGSPQSSAGPVGLYNAGDWTLLVLTDPSGARVSELRLGWNAAKGAQIFRSK